MLSKATACFGTLSSGWIFQDPACFFFCPFTQPSNETVPDTSRSLGVGLGIDI